MDQYQTLMKDMGMQDTKKQIFSKKRGQQISMTDLMTNDTGNVKMAMGQLNKTVGLQQTSHNQIEQGDRRVGMNQVKNEVDKWGDVIRKQKQIKTADYRDKVRLGKRIEGDFVESSGTFGGQVEKKLKELAMDSEASILQKERQGLSKVDSKESERRVHQLRKQREIMFEEETKHKRMKKIKSKIYRKIKNKQKKTDIDDEQNEENQLDRLVEERATERVSLKHRTQGKYIKQLMRYGGDKDRVQGAVQDVNDIKNQIMKKYTLKETQQINQDYDDIHFREQAIQEIEREFLKEDKEGGEVKEGKTFMEKLNRAKQIKNREEAEMLVERLQDKEDELSLEEEQEEEEEEEGELDSEEEDIRNALEKEKSDKKAKKEKAFQGRKSYSGVDVVAKNIDEQIDADITSGIDVNTLKKKYQKDNIGELKEEHLQEFNKEIVHANDLEQAFIEDKREQIELHLPEEETTLQGWGAWTGNGIQHKVIDKEALKRKKQAMVQQINTNRQDNKKTQVVINEERSKGVTQYLVKKLPFQFKNKEQFNYLNNQSVGHEWNMLKEHNKLIAPKVKTTKGQVIGQVQWETTD